MRGIGPEERTSKKLILAVVFNEHGKGKCYFHFQFEKVLEVNLFCACT